MERRIQKQNSTAHHFRARFCFILTKYCFEVLNFIADTFKG